MKTSTASLKSPTGISQEVKPSQDVQTFVPLSRAESVPAPMSQREPMMKLLPSKSVGAADDEEEEDDE